LSTDVSEVRTASIIRDEQAEAQKDRGYIGVGWQGGQWWWETIGWKRANGSVQVVEVVERERDISTKDVT
jgi:hypothetical protein